MTSLQNSYLSVLKLALMIELGVLMASCSSPQEPSLNFYLVYQNADGLSVTNPDLAEGLPQSVKYISGKDSEGVFVTTPAVMDKTCLSDISAGEHVATGSPILEFQFTDVCTEKFATFTSQNIGRQMAVVLNDTLYAAPYLNAPISSGKAFIEGFETKAEAEKLALSFKTTK
jgi:preprotein translocase subunit SecD